MRLNCATGYAAAMAVIAIIGASAIAYMWSCFRDPGYVFPDVRLFRTGDDDRSGGAPAATGRSAGLLLVKMDDSVQSARTSTDANEHRDLSQIPGECFAITAPLAGSQAKASALLNRVSPPADPVGMALAAGHAEQVCLLCAAVYPPDVTAAPPLASANAGDRILSLGQSDHLAKHCKKCNRYGNVRFAYLSS